MKLILEKNKERDVFFIKAVLEDVPKEFWNDKWLTTEKPIVEPLVIATTDIREAIEKAKEIKEWFKEFGKKVDEYRREVEEFMKREVLVWENGDIRYEN